MPDLRPAGMTCTEAAELAPAFVVGALEPDEAAAVRSHLAGCPQAHLEFEELGSVAVALLETVPIAEPPSELRARVLGSVSAPQPQAGVRTPEPDVAAAGPIADDRQPRPRLLVEPARPSTAARRGTWVFGVAATLALLMFGAWNVSLQLRLGEATRYTDAITAVLALARQPGSATVVLAPAADGGPAGLAVVGPDAAVRVVLRGLAPTNGDEVYEAWAIGASGSATPIGGFTVGTDGVGTLVGRGQPPNEVAAVAVTHELAPGATSPRLPIIVSGPVTGADS
jgi:hypothetical protein